MAITLDDFKQAFKGHTEKGRVDRLDQQITEGLKALKKLASTLQASGDRTSHDALVELVARFAEAIKPPNRAAGDVEVRLQEIRRDTLSQVAKAVAATKASRRSTDALPAPAVGAGDVSGTQSSEMNGAPTGVSNGETTHTPGVQQQSPPVQSPDSAAGDRKRLSRGKIEQIEQKLRKLASDHGITLR